MIHFVSLLLAVFTYQAHAKRIDLTQGKIDYLYCGNLDALTGATSISYSGVLGGKIYFNVSNLLLGVPYSEQAVAESAQRTPGGLIFKIRTVVTDQIFYLEVYDGTHTGFVSRDFDSQKGLRLTCTAYMNFPR